MEYYSDMDTLETNGLRLYLIELLQASRLQSKNVARKAVATHYEAYERLLENLIVFLSKNKGEMTMAKLKSEIKILREVNLADLLVSSRGGTIIPRIKELAASLKEGKAGEVDPDGIAYEHFAGRVYAAIEDKVVPEEIRPMKRGDKFYIVKYPKGEAPPLRRNQEKVR